MRPTLKGPNDQVQNGNGHHVPERFALRFFFVGTGQREHCLERGYKEQYNFAMSAFCVTWIFFSAFYKALIGILLSKTPTRRGLIVHLILQLCAFDVWIWQVQGGSVTIHARFFYIVHATKSTTFLTSEI